MLLCIGGNGDIVMMVLMTTAVRVAFEIYLIVCFVVVSLVLVVVLVVVTLVELGWLWL